MKKVLFATTALVASAGIASAEVALKGGAEMGIVGGTGMNLQFHTDVDVNFVMTGTTSGGLEFFANVDLDESWQSPATGNPALANDADDGGVVVGISGAFGRLAMGDEDGALDWALPESGIVGTINDAETGHGGYSGYGQVDGAAPYDGQIATYTYSFGSFSARASIQLDDAAAPVAANYGIGVQYKGTLGGADVTFGAGYHSYANALGAQSAFGAGVDVKYHGFQVIVTYADLGDTDAGGTNETHYGIAVGYSMNDISVAANWGQYSEGAATQSGYGISAQYALGGGAAIAAGYGNTSTCGVYASCAIGDSYSLGFIFNF